jgi:hypothetical protein
MHHNGGHKALLGPWISQAGLPGSCRLAPDEMTSGGPLKAPTQHAAHWGHTAMDILERWLRRRPAWARPRGSGVPTAPAGPAMKRSGSDETFGFGMYYTNQQIMGPGPGPKPNCFICLQMMRSGFERE